jgi:cytoskeletal protein CcmA (bactofilin family)
MAAVSASGSASGASASSEHPSGTSDVTTLLGRGSEFEGKLSFEGTVRVDGKLSGEIFTDDVLIVGEGAEVKAEIHVGAIVVEGTVHGNIHAKRSVEIRTPGRVRGNITTPSLFIEKGVVFDGNCQMESQGVNAVNAGGSNAAANAAKPGATPGGTARAATPVPAAAPPAASAD